MENFNFCTVNDESYSADNTGNVNCFTKDPQLIGQNDNNQLYTQKFWYGWGVYFSLSCFRIFGVT